LITNVKNATRKFLRNHNAGTGIIYTASATNKCRLSLSFQKKLPMKFILPAIICLAFSTRPVTDDCASIHTGTFYFYPRNSMRSYKIVRSDTYQQEFNLSTGDSSINSVQWMDPCTYKLTFISGSAKRPAGYKPPVITIHLLTATSGYYIMRASVDSLHPAMGTQDTVWLKPKLH